MRKNITNHSVTIIMVSVAILAITVTGILFSDFYSPESTPIEDEVAARFDPDRLPPPAAGIAGRQIFPRNCDDINYRTTQDGIKYVRLAGGGTLIGAEYNKKFGFYRIEYGLLNPVDAGSVDSFTKEKLKYALYNCDGPFTLTGVGF